VSAPADGFARDATVDDGGGLPQPTRRHLPVVTSRHRGPLNIAGQRFGTLTAVEYTHSAGNGVAHWRVRCDCGAIRVVAGTKLRAGECKCSACSRAVRPPPKGRVYVHRTEPRATTLSARRGGLAELRASAAEYPPEEFARYERPRTRGDCLAGGINEARPCPWVSCVAHLGIDVNEDAGGLKITFPGTDVADMRDTCALDIAERSDDGASLDEVGAAMNLTRARVAMIEAVAPKLAADLVDEVEPHSALRSIVRLAR